MIDLNRIRSVKTLQNMKKDLEFFISSSMIKDIYLSDFQWGEEDLDADRELASILLRKVVKKIDSITRKNTPESDNSISQEHTEVSDAKP